MIQRAIQGVDLKFETSQLCSLRATWTFASSDKGSKGLDRLDLICGYGLFGIFAAKFT
jgi:hypothetical protein